MSSMVEQLRGVERPIAAVPCPSAVVRVPIHGHLTAMQEICVRMLATGKHNNRSIGEHLGISWTTVKKYVNLVAAKIPGDLPAQARVVAWWRGAPLTVLTGRDAQGRSVA